MQSQPAQLTSRQLQVMAFMRQFLAANGQMPPVQTISAYFGWTSPNSAQQHINSLSRKGVLERNVIGSWRFTRPKQEEGAQCIPFVK